MQVVPEEACAVKWGNSIGQSQLERSAIGLVLAKDKGESGPGEKGLRREFFSTILLPSAWEDVMPSALQPGVHEERIAQQEDKRSLSTG